MAALKSITLIFETHPEQAPLFLALYRVLVRPQSAHERIPADAARDREMLALPEALAELAECLPAALADRVSALWTSDERRVLRRFLQAWKLTTDPNEEWAQSLFSKSEWVFADNVRVRTILRQNIWKNPQAFCDSAQRQLTFDQWSQRMLDPKLSAVYLKRLQSVGTGLSREIVARLRWYWRSKPKARTPRNRTRAAKH